MYREKIPPNVLYGIRLRYALTVTLADNGLMTVGDLVDELERQGFEFSGAAAAKTVSDALRWEVNHGRVSHRARGVYGPGGMPRSTEYRIRKRVEQLRAQALQPASDDESSDDEYWAAFD